MERRVARCLTSAAILWAAAIFLAPLAHLLHVGGTFAEIVRMAGALVCHQRVERTFEIAGDSMPVCARCTGLYLSGALGAVAAWLTVPLMPRRTRTVIVAAAVPTIVTIAVEWAGLAQPGNVGRALAAVPIGAACGWIFVRLLRAEAAACVIIS
jgi:uncharacterized membrane protein